MDWLSILQQIFELCIIPLLGIVIKFVIEYIAQKKEQIKTQTDNELAQKYLDILNDTIAKCVTATNQTYVESLKEQNAFDADAQKEAFNKTYNAVIETLGDEANKYLPMVIGDLQTYITERIEASVKESKQ